MVAKQQRDTSLRVFHPHLSAQKHHPVVGGQFVVVSHTLMFQTGEAPHFIDLTPTVGELVHHAKVQSGMVHIFSKHTTTAIAVNESEPLLLSDMRDLLERLIPSTRYYRHDDMAIRTVNLPFGIEEKANGYAHCQSLFLGGSYHFPLLNGCLDLGQWQRIFLVELDGSRMREVVVQISGVHF